MKKALAIASVALLLAAPSMGAGKPAAPAPKNGPEIIELKSATMTLQFPHRKHQASLKIVCSTCHQPDSSDRKISWNTTTAHKVCLKCHMEKEEGLRECTGCHKLR